MLFRRLPFPSPVVDFRHVAVAQQVFIFRSSPQKLFCKMQTTAPETEASSCLQTPARRPPHCALTHTPPSPPATVTPPWKILRPTAGRFARAGGRCLGRGGEAGSCRSLTFLACKEDVGHHILYHLLLLLLLHHQLLFCWLSRSGDKSICGSLMCFVDHFLCC